MSLRKDFVIKKSLLSSQILTTGLALTTVGYGELTVKDVILKTGSTGLATGTNVEIYSDNANGATVILAEAVSNLGANKTVNIDSASVAKQKTVLESGKKISIRSTVANCTGAGTIDIYLILERADGNANIASS